MQTTNLYDEVIDLIGAAQGINDQTRQSMIKEIRTEGISPEMQERIMELFSTELGDRDVKIKQGQGVIEKIMQVRAQSDAATLPESQGVQSDFSRATEAVTNELETVCAREARTVDSAVGNALQERDSDAADAVRQSLKI
ncbi:MAG: hypothetical protein KBC47_03725 [Candidatus Peribacteraceae bacterium]|nr:hypothetical protein [Candidatus Peribacteraceae bacterium]